MCGSAVRRASCRLPWQGGAAAPPLARRLRRLLLADGGVPRQGPTAGAHRDRHRRAGCPLSGHMGGGFRPFRRNVAWCVAQETPIRPLLGQLAFTRDNKNWGYKLRFGLFEVTDADMEIIAAAMGAGICPRD